MGQQHSDSNPDPNSFSEPFAESVSVALAKPISRGFTFGHLRLSARLAVWFCTVSAHDTSIVFFARDFAWCINTFALRLSYQLS